MTPDNEAPKVEDDGEAQNAAADTGAACLALLLRFFGQPSDPVQIRREYGRPGHTLNAEEMLRAAKRLRLKARNISTSWDRLARTPLPAVAQLNDGLSDVSTCGTD